MAMDLLENCQEPIRKTRLFRQANMNHDQGERYLRICLDEDLVRRDDGRFVVSGAGRDALQGWRRVEDKLLL